MRVFRIFIALLILICLLPPFALLAASLLARWAGCDLDPDIQLACPVAGGDYGDILHAIAHFGWYAEETLPILAALLVGWTVVEIMRALGGARKPAASQTPADSRNRERGS